MNGDHTTIHKGYSVAHWKKNSAVGCNDDWDTAHVRAVGTSVGIYVDTKHELLQLKTILDAVFQMGREAKSREIRKALEIGK
jgi:hypothetical protein